MQIWQNGYSVLTDDITYIQPLDSSLGQMGVYMANLKGLTILENPL